MERYKFLRLTSIGNRIVSKEQELSIENKELQVDAVYTSDVIEALATKEIPLTKENIEAAVTHLELLAGAWVKAALQDYSQEEWLFNIETFKEGLT